MIYTPGLKVDPSRHPLPLGSISVKLWAQRYLIAGSQWGKFLCPNLPAPNGPTLTSCVKKSPSRISTASGHRLTSTVTAAPSTGVMAVSEWPPEAQKLSTEESRERHRPGWAANPHADSSQNIPTNVSSVVRSLG